jgi:predicted phage tail protein
MQASTINYQPMITIRLHGQLRQFGKSFRLAVKSPAEAIQALCVQTPGFERFLSNAKSRGLEFAVFRDKRNIGENELKYCGAGDIRIAPVVVGSKRGGILQTIVGAILIVVGVIFSARPFGTPLIGAGIGLVAGGVIQMLSPQAGGLKTSAAPQNTPTLRPSAIQFRFVRAAGGGAGRLSVPPFMRKTRCRVLR